MDLKKFLDQTVREVKREVNKKVLKVPEIEQKVYEATSNEPWGPHGTLMGDIAQATRNFNEYQMIMGILWKRLNDVGKNWRHVYKSLTVLEFLVANGAERIIDELREHSYQVQTLCDFQYIEAGGKDQGVNVRKKAQSLVALLSDKEKIREVRAKAAANRDKYRGVSSTGSFSKSGSYSSTGGGYGGDSYNDDDRYGGSTRGGRDDDRYGDRDRDRDDRYRDDRYRDDDRSTRDSTGDRYRDDRDRDRFEDDRYGSSKGGDGYSNDKYGDDSKNEGSASGYGRDRDRDRSFEEDERYPPRRANGSGSGTKADDYAQDDREPSGLAAAVARAHTSQSNLSQTSSNASQGTEKKPENRLHTASSVGGSYFASNPAADDLDDFDPRGSFSASSAAPRDEDSFGTASPAAVPANTPAPLSVPAPFLPPVKSTSGIEDLFGDTGFETSFAVPAPAPVSNTTVQGNGLQSEDLFGSPAFAAVHPSTTSFPAPAPAPLPSLAPRANSVPNGNFQAFGPASTDEHNSSFGTSFSAVPPAINSTSISPQTSFLPPPPPTSSYSSTNSFQIPSGSAQAPNFPSYTSGSSSQVPFGQQAPLGGTTYGQSASTTSLLSSQVPPNNNTYAPPPPKPQQKSFQTKSGIWNDTISAGLVDLNISGPKTNPLAELGIDLKDSIFSAQEMRKKEEKILPTASNMGRAMGSGTGLGLAGAGGIAPPPVQPAMAGMNMGMGMGMRQPGMGMGMGVNPGFGVPGAPPNLGYGPGPGMGINPGFGISPGMGMAPGMGMNPGMAGYGPGMGTVQGGYTPGVGLGGYPNQQYVPSGVRDLPAEVGVQMSDFGRSAPNLPVLASGVRDRLADVGSQVSDLGRRAPNLPAVTFCVKDRVADVGAQVSDLGRRAPNLPAVAFGVRDRVTDVGAQSSDLGLSARRSVDGLTSEHTEGKIPNLKNFEVDVKYLVADETNPRDRVSDMGAQISGLGHRARRSTDGFTNEDNEGKIPKPQEFPS